MSYWPGNNGKMASNSNFKAKFSEKSADLVRGFCFQLGAI